MIAGRPASAQSLRHIGFNRGSFLGGAHGPSHREWLHFCVHDDEVDLLVNFSAFTSTDASQEARPIPRLTLLARDARGWHGAVESYGFSEGGLPGGTFGAWMPGGRAELDGDDVVLEVALERPRILVELRLTPRAVASPTHNVTIDRSPPLNWLVMPRLSATGYVWLEDRCYSLRAAPAYHDHNWGAFRWGADFRWEWGYVLPRARDGSNPWTIIAVRLTNRSRTSLLEQGVLVWHGAELVRTFRGHLVTVSAEGHLGRAPTIRIPTPLALVAGGRATDVPRRLTFEGRDGADEIRVDFQPESVAQILVPDDTGPTLTVVNEVSCRARVVGRIEGLALDFHGGGFVELLGR